MTSPAPSTVKEDLQPLDVVLRRLHASSGFPTLSTTISDVNRVVVSDSHSAQQITQVILRDVSLTTRLLQLVNSPVYCQFRSGIRTVSRAVLILGCEAIRSAAMALMMLEFSKGRPQEKSLQDELVGAFFAGMLSKALCRQLGLPNAEEAVICTMCQNLGKMAVTFFLYDESRKVRALVTQGMAEERAAEQVLGVSYRKVGVGLAKHWNFPDRLLDGMQNLAARDMTPPATDGDNLRLAANLANDLYITALRTPPEDKAAALQALSKKYSGAIKLATKDLSAAIDQSLKEIGECSTTLSLPTAGSPALSAVRVWTGGTVVDSAEGVSQKAGADPLMQNVETLDALEKEKGEAADSKQVISAGIRDVTEALTSDFALNDILRMVLETMHRGFSFHRTMIFIRDARLNTMRARFGFGSEVERLIPQCNFPMAFAPDVFHVALEKGVDIVIENAQAENIVQRIPEWHRQVVNPRSFLLLPIMLKSAAVGLLYADCEREGIKLDAEQLGSLRTLRSQVVLAFKHCAASGKT